jgi:hypothetical protein
MFTASVNPIELSAHTVVVEFVCVVMVVGVEVGVLEEDVVELKYKQSMSSA